MIYDNPKTPTEQLINAIEALNNCVKDNIELTRENFYLKCENEKLKEDLNNLNITNITKKE